MRVVAGRTNLVLAVICTMTAAGAKDVSLSVTETK